MVKEGKPSQPWEPLGSFRDWISLSMNSNITLDIIKSHPELPWRWDFALMNSNIPIDYILYNINNEQWDLKWLSQHPNLTMDIVKSHPEISW